MLWCLDCRDIKSSRELQTKIKLERMIRSKSILLAGGIDSLTEREKEYIRPVYVCTMVRSGYSNEVVSIDYLKANKVFYHTLCTEDVESFPPVNGDGKSNENGIGLGYDLVMLLSSVSIRSMLKDDVNTDALNTCMVNGSIYDVVGFYYDEVLDPIMLCIVTLKDEEFSSFFSKNLGEGYSIVSIKDAKEKYSLGNLQVFMDRLVITKPRKEERG